LILFDVLLFRSSIRVPVANENKEINVMTSKKPGIDFFIGLDLDSNIVKTYLCW